MEKNLIYLDNCCYNRLFDDQSQIKINLEASAKLEIQRQIRHGEILLVSSYILLLENNANRFSAKKEAISNFIDNYTYRYISEKYDDRIKELASEIMKTGIKLFDACHIACAVFAGCGFFISTDKRVLKCKDDRINIMNPVEYILESEV